MSTSPLAPRDLLILSVLAEGSLHGYGIIKAVEERSTDGVLLDPANLYRALRRMRRDGWIAEADRKGPDPRRRSFRLTPAGRTVLSSEVRRLEALLEIVKPNTATGRGS
ncbi:MAG: PadR family transcriptional regulator [Gemmatimonadetes bacterium]|nr:PadR family transcriptional regulator [Gemmatimonadota bacterium]